MIGFSKKRNIFLKMSPILTMLINNSKKKETHALIPVGQLEIRNNLKSWYSNKKHAHL